MSLRHEPEVPWKELRADALLVTAAENVRYLTGFTGTNGLVLLFRDREPVFFTDPRYAIQSAQEVPCRTVVVPKGGLIPAAAKLLKKVRAKAIGFDRVHLTFAAYEKLESVRSSWPLAPPQMAPASILALIVNSPKMPA